MVRRARAGFCRAYLHDGGLFFGRYAHARTRPMMSRFSYSVRCFPAFLLARKLGNPGRVLSYSVSIFDFHVHVVLLLSIWRQTAKGVKMAR